MILEVHRWVSCKAPLNSHWCSSIISFIRHHDERAPSSDLAVSCVDFYEFLTSLFLDALLSDVHVRRYVR